MAVVGEMVCPRCGAVVLPAVDAQGGLHCPACNDTGVIEAPPVWPQPGAPPPARASDAALAPNADGAVLTLVFGVLALAVPYAGVAFGVLALVYGKRAAAAIAASGGTLQGRGMVTAGRVLAVVGIVFWGVALLIAGSAVVFVLVSNLGASDGGGTVPDLSFSKDESGPGGTVTVVRAPAGVDWSDLQVRGEIPCDTPFGQVMAGDVITCPEAGTVEIVHLPTNTLVYVTTFQD